MIWPATTVNYDIESRSAVVRVCICRRCRPACQGYREEELKKAASRVTPMAGDEMGWGSSETRCARDRC